MEGLRDIKGVVEISEPSLWWFLALLFLVILSFGVAFYLFKNRRKRRKKPTPKELALKALKVLDFSNTKEVVYTFLEEGRLFVNEKNQEEFNSIAKALEPYKYRREVPPLDEGLKRRIEQFIKGAKI